MTGQYYQVRFGQGDGGEVDYFILSPDDYYYDASSKEDAINTAKQYGKDMEVGAWVTKITEEDIDIPETDEEDEDEYFNYMCDVIVEETFEKVTENNSKMVIMQGGPGTGKTYTATKLVKKIPGAVKVSADDYFTDEDGVYRFDGTRIREAHRVCREKTINALKEGSVVIVDNCNATNLFVKPYLEMTPSPKVIVELHPKSMEDALLFGDRSVHDVPKRSLKKCHYSVKRIESDENELHYITRV